MKLFFRIAALFLFLISLNCNGNPSGDFPEEIWKNKSLPEGAEFKTPYETIWFDKNGILWIVPEPLSDNNKDSPPPNFDSITSRIHSNDIYILLDARKMRRAQNDSEFLFINSDRIKRYNKTIAFLTPSIFAKYIVNFTISGKALDNDKITFFNFEDNAYAWLLKSSGVK